MKPEVLYIKLPLEEKTALAQLTATSGAAVGHNVTMSEVVRQLVRDAAASGKPVRVKKG